MNLYIFSITKTSYNFSYALFVCSIHNLSSIFWSKYNMILTSPLCLFLSYTKIISFCYQIWWSENQLYLKHLSYHAKSYLESPSEPGVFKCTKKNTLPTKLKGCCIDNVDESVHLYLMNDFIRFSNWIFQLYILYLYFIKECNTFLLKLEHDLFARQLRFPYFYT